MTRCKTSEQFLEVYLFLINEFFFVFACKTGYCGECCLFMCVKCNNINNNYMGNRIDIKQTKRLNVFYVGVNCVIKVGRK